MTIATMPTLNTTLLSDLIRWAERDEEIDHKWWGTWDQGSWGWAINDEEAKQARNGSCKTAYCMAGQAAHQAGYRLEYSTTDTIFRDIWMHDGSHFEGQVATAMSCVQQYDTGRKDRKGHPIWEDIPNADSVQISVVGRDALGLTDDEAGYFFDGDNGLTKLKMMANRFCEDRGLPLLFLDHKIYEPEDDDDEDYD